MTHPKTGGGTCHVCGRSLPTAKMRPWISVRPGVSNLIEAQSPGWAEGANICLDDLAKARSAYVENLLEQERGELGRLDREVIAALEAQQFVSRNPIDAVEEQITLGDRIADRVARFGGSWGFILSFVVILLIWVIVNASGALLRPFDPYPFILMNLVLSMIAALQAPVIMMSQRRQEQKDRIRSESDYRVNLKAELEIRQLHEKLDHQLARQWEKLAELQQIQIELLEEGVRGSRND